MRLVTRPRYWLNLNGGCVGGIVKMAGYGNIFKTLVENVLPVPINQKKNAALNVGEECSLTGQAQTGAHGAPLDRMQIN